MIKNLFIFNFKVLLAPALIIFTFLLAEGVFRIKYFGVDAILNYKEYGPRPSSKFKMSIDSEYGKAFMLVPNKISRIRGKIFSSNSQGFREAETEFEQTGRKYRIAIIGSSYSGGMGVLEHERYGNQLQILLDNNFPDQYQVLNFAIPGSPISEVISLYEARVKNLKPDLVIYPPRKLEVLKKYKSKQSKHNDLDIRKHFFSGSYIYAFLRYEFKSWHSKYIHVNWKSRLTGYSSNRSKDNIQKNITYLEGFLERRVFENTSTILLSLPKTNQSEPFFDDMKFKELASKYPNIYYMELFSSLAGKINIHDNIYPGDNHPNAKVHKLYAEGIYEILVPLLDKIKKADSLRDEIEPLPVN